MRLKALRNLLRSPVDCGFSAEDISPECSRARTYAPGSIFEASEAEAAKLLRVGAAEETQDAVSSPGDLEALRQSHDKFLKLTEEARLEKILKSQE